jgi:hypothetical protein
MASFAQTCTMEAARSAHEETIGTCARLSLPGYCADSRFTGLQLEKKGKKEMKIKITLCER